jgi:hypothetical protein
VVPQTTKKDLACEPGNKSLTTTQKDVCLKEAVQTMKKTIILISALLSAVSMLMSCSSERETTVATTSQSATTSAPPLLMTKTHTRSLSGQPSMDAGSY